MPQISQYSPGTCVVSGHSYPKPENLPYACRGGVLGLGYGGSVSEGAGGFATGLISSGA